MNLRPESALILMVIVGGIGTATASEYCAEENRGGCGEFQSCSTEMFDGFDRPDWLDFSAAYRGEVFSNLHGGLTTKDAGRYTGRVDLLVTGDLSQLERSPGGTFVIHFQSLAGEGVTDRYVGAAQRISNIDGNPGAGFHLTQISQVWWQRSVTDDLTIKLGKILADSEFALTTLGGDFINTSFGWTHTLPLAAYPDPTAGVVGNYMISNTFSVKCGIFDGAPNGGNWGFSGTGDVQSLLEVRNTHTLFNASLPGDSHVGVWYHNGQFADPNGLRRHTGNHGVYGGFSQQLTRESPCDEQDLQGLGGFVHWGFAPQDRNAQRGYWGGGLVYRGLIRDRDFDTAGVGIGNMRFSDHRLAGHSDETVVELFYKARLGKYLTLQPDLQYFSNPGGRSRDSYVAGLRLELTL